MVSSPELTIEELKGQCLCGDDNAWRELYRRVFGRARSIAKAPPFCFDTASAEDIAQDVVVVLTRQLVDVGNVMGFIGRVTHNKCVDRVRKKKELSFSGLTMHDALSPDSAQHLEGPSFLPEELDDSRTLSLLRAALSDIGSPCHKLLYFRFFEELSYEEVARTTEIPGKQIGVYIARCLKKLRTHIERDSTAWGELVSLLRT